MSNDGGNLVTMSLQVVSEALQSENKQVTDKILDGSHAVNEAPDAMHPMREIMAQQRKQEIFSWLRQRLNAGLISK